MASIQRSEYGSVKLPYIYEINKALEMILLHQKGMRKGEQNIKQSKHLGVVVALGNETAEQKRTGREFVEEINRRSTGEEVVDVLLTTKDPNTQKALQEESDKFERLRGRGKGEAQGIHGVST
jgi:hypothetical protein